MSITVRFFASLQEQVGFERTDVEPGSLETVRDVWRSVVDRDPDAKVLVAVNARHAVLDTEIRDGDEVAFFPPVTGG